MTRSLTDRVLGGVCGGIATTFRVNAWLVRAAFVLLTPVSVGLAAVLYVVLWWAVPQQSFIRVPGGGGLLAFLVLTLLVAGVGTARFAGILRADLYLPVVFVVFCLVYFLKQVRA